MSEQALLGTLVLVVYFLIGYLSFEILFRLIRYGIVKYKEKQEDERRIEKRKQVLGCY